MQNLATQTVVAAAGPPMAPPQTASIKYCLYARKSSEDDERQALSIESQIKEMLATAERDGLNIVEVRRESHSAKASGMRPVYNRLVEEIRAGFFNGILTWAPDRLSRNAGDLGAIVDLMDQGLLKEIRTHGQRFTNSPNEKFLLMILCSQAKLENDNRGINVKRGQRSKLEMGHRPCLAPLGYLNEKLTTRGESKILIDPSKADENHYLTASKLLDICKRAKQIFESSEPDEKRQFLNFLLQNCRLRGKEPMFTLKPVFASIVSAHKNASWLRAVQELRTVILSGWKSYELEAAVEIIKKGLDAYEAKPT